MNKTYLFYAAIIAAVVIAYFFIGEYALGGLAAMVFGSPKVLKQKSKDAAKEAEVYEEQGEAQREEVIAQIDEVDASHDETINIAESATTLHEATPNTTRHTIRSR